MLVEAGTRPPSTPPSFPSGDSLPFAPISAMPYLHRPTRIPIVSGRLATDCSVPLRALLFVSLCLYPFANLLPPASFCLSSYVCLLLYVSFCLPPFVCLLLSLSFCVSPTVCLLMFVSFFLSPSVCLLLSVSLCLSVCVIVSMSMPVYATRVSAFASFYLSACLLLSVRMYMSRMLLELCGGLFPSVSLSVCVGV